MLGDLIFEFTAKDSIMSPVLLIKRLSKCNKCEKYIGTFVPLSVHIVQVMAHCGTSSSQQKATLPRARFDNTTSWLQNIHSLNPFKCVSLLKNTKKRNTKKLKKYKVQKYNNGDFNKGKGLTKPPVKVKKN